MSRHRRPGYLRLSWLRNGRPLGNRRSFIFPLLDCLEHITRLRNSRPVDFLLRLTAVRPGRTGAILPVTLKVLAHPFCFIFFQRTGVGLLLGHADVCQGIEDRPALHFQLAC